MSVVMNLEASLVNNHLFGIASPGGVSQSAVLPIISGALC